MAESNKTKTLLHLFTAYYVHGFQTEKYSQSGKADSQTHLTIFLMFLDQNRSYQGFDHELFAFARYSLVQSFAWASIGLRSESIEARQDQIEAKAKDQAQQY